MCGWTQKQPKTARSSYRTTQVAKKGTLTEYSFRKAQGFSAAVLLSVNDSQGKEGACEWWRNKACIHTRLGLRRL